MARHPEEIITNHFIGFKRIFPFNVYIFSYFQQLGVGQDRPTQLNRRTAKMVENPFNFYLESFKKVVWLVDFVDLKI